MAADNPPTTQRNPIMDYAISAFAVVIVIVFFIFIRYLLGQTTLAEPQWSRTIYLYNGVEAVAFTAAGFLFGREVNRHRAEAAETRADSNEKAASSGRALAVAANVKAQTQSSGLAGEYGALGAEAQAQVSQSAVNELAQMARELFPETIR